MNTFPLPYRYNKICKAESNFNEYSPDIGQFSQVIWKDTDFIGLGRSTRDKGDLLCTYIVARYSPQATKSGFAENVQKGAFNDDVSCPRKCPSSSSRDNVGGVVAVFDSKNTAESSKTTDDTTKTPMSGTSKQGEFFF